MAYLASFGGITRIRFKGFDRHFSPIISATRLPRTLFLGQNKTRRCEVKGGHCRRRLVQFGVSQKRPTIDNRFKERSPPIRAKPANWAVLLMAASGFPPA
jgi:hypothetical protein